MTTGVEQVDHVTDTINSQAVETAAAAKDLARQAVELQDLLNTFKVA